jgi:A/G-specific adenine glycosylase
MKSQEPEKPFFTRQLMHWHATANHRDLPWKGERNPYKIWLSEIILQQTRAEQGLPYYLLFTEAYPTVADLADTNDEAAFRLWQGLGYYNRCKNMLATARQVMGDLGGKFPDSYEGLLGLKGVGPYTAAAIASFAYGLPQAVVDGNVNRVLSRYFGIDTPFDTTEGKKKFQQLASELLDTTDSAAYNQAIMDLGATVCTPQNPKCSACPLSNKCVAYHQNLIALLPVKSKKQAVKARYFHYLLLHVDNQIWLHKRGDKDIWQNLYEPYLIESEASLDTHALQQTPNFQALYTDEPPTFEGTLTQRLTHQLIETRFYRVDLKKKTIVQPDDGEWITITELKKYAFPKTLVSYFEKKHYF